MMSFDLEGWQDFSLTLRLRVGMETGNSVAIKGREGKGRGLFQIPDENSTFGSLSKTWSNRQMKRFLNLVLGAAPTKNCIF